MIIVKIKNSREELMWKCIFALAGSALVVFIAISGIIYSKTVGLKHAISSYEESLVVEKAKNAELKSDLFQITDPKLIGDIAKEKGLVEDINPQWVFASSL